MFSKMTEGSWLLYFSLLTLMVNAFPILEISLQFRDDNKDGFPNAIHYDLGDDIRNGYLSKRGFTFATSTKADAKSSPPLDYATMPDSPYVHSSPRLNDRSQAKDASPKKIVNLVVICYIMVSPVLFLCGCLFAASAKEEMDARWRAIDFEGRSTIRKVFKAIFSTAMIYTIFFVVFLVIPFLP